MTDSSYFVSSNCRGLQSQMLGPTLEISPTTTKHKTIKMKKKDK